MLLRGTSSSETLLVNIHRDVALRQILFTTIGQTSKLNLSLDISNDLRPLFACISLVSKDRNLLFDIDISLPSSTKGCEFLRSGF